MLTTGSLIGSRNIDMMWSQTVVGKLFCVCCMFIHMWLEMKSQSVFQIHYNAHFFTDVPDLMVHCHTFCSLM